MAHQTPSLSWWQDLQGLFRFASGSLGDLQGQSLCFDLDLEGEAHFCEDSVRIRVTIRQQLEAALSGSAVSASDASSPETKAVLRLRKSDWETVGKHCSTLRALWTNVQINGTVVILDATVGPAFIVGSATLREDETVQVVELFCGGFAGWSQAAWALAEAGSRVRVRWMLDIEDDYQQLLAVPHQGAQAVQGTESLLQADWDSSPVIILGNFEHTWWFRAWTHAFPDMVVASPPCQPWSTAGQQTGLDSPDGRLLLRLAAVCGAVQAPVVCIEEVQGFRTHPDFGIVMRAWHEAGYSCVYEQALQLSEVAPTWRKRFFLIFCNKACGRLSQGPLQVVDWHAHPRPSLARLRAYFPVLPNKLLKPCRLEPQVLDVYLDPWYLPPGHPNTEEGTRRFRLCHPGQQAKCFMAAYHRQHALPEGLLSRSGLLCSLLVIRDSIRFFSAPEIAACHGALRAMLIPADDSLAMTALGNALATPQAVWSWLTHSSASSIRGPPQTQLPLSVSGGWILTHLQEFGLVLADAVLREQIEHRLQRAAASFYQLSLGEGTQESFVELAVVHCSTHVTLQAAAAALGICIEEAPDEPVRAAEVVQVRVDQVPFRPFRDTRPDGLAAAGATMLYTPSGLVLLQSGVPDWLHQLKWSFDLCRMHAGSVACLSCFGERLKCVSDFPDTVFVATDADDLYFAAPSFSRVQVGASSLKGGPETFCIEVQAEHAVAWWLQFPAHLLECLGWQCVASDMPKSPHGCFQLHCTPAAATASLPLDQLRPYLRDVLFLAQLKARAADATALSDDPLLLQVVARTLGSHRLPQDLTVDNIEHAWRTACNATGCWPNARIYSGPHPLEVSANVRTIASTGPAHRRMKDGQVVLTVMPELRGGGVKDENIQLAKSRLASLMLDRGVTLPEATQSVDALVPALGTAACLHALSQGDSRKQWQTLAQSAQSVGKELPAGDNRTEKAAYRIQQAVRRRRLTQAANIRAADYCLEEGTWCGMDEQPVPVLDAVRPDCCGVVLIDAAEANTQDIALLKNMSAEALCLVIPGHTCPDPSTCAGTTSVPAMHRATGTRQLLAACYHNVGETDIRPHYACSTTVSVDGTVCCSFTMHRDEAPSSQAWTEAVQAPVKTVVELFRGCGVQQALSNPWGRSFRSSGRPSQPHSADTYQFFAKVLRADLKPVLQQSGFNRVYVVPRGWDRQLLPGWSVIWLSGQRGEVEKQALLVPEQHGVVRSRNRYGLRVPETVFPRVFAQLRPGADVPLNISVKGTYKLGPVPAAASAEDVQTWARNLQWPMKVIKALGPQFWLLGAATPPPAETALFNDQPVLIVPVRQREAPAPIVQAGRPLPGAGPAKQQPSQPSTTDPWLISDPWSAYKAAQKPAPPTQSAVAPTRTVDQQLSQRVHDQETKLAELQQSLQALRTEHHEAQQVAAQDKHQVMQDLQSVRAEVQGVGSTMQQQLQASLDGMRSAQAQQEQQMKTGMDELKECFPCQQVQYNTALPANTCQFLSYAAPYVRHCNTSGFAPRAFLSLLRSWQAVAAPSIVFPAPAGLGSTMSLLCGILLWRCAKPPYWRARLMCGYRIGEASHPGPPRQKTLTAYFGSDPKATTQPVPPTRDTCVIAVVNPTSVLHKVPLFLETGADVLALAETSAVEHAQRVTGRALSRHHFRAHWGRPVPCHRREGAPTQCLRGLAAGVALFSRLPSRASQPPLPEAAVETCRLCEAFVRFGALEVRMLTVYCWPLSHLDASERNEQLLSMALQRATSSPVPCIVAGDFNQPLQQLPSGQAFAALGYQDVFALHKGATGVDLPATCKGSTRNDTALLHPVLLPLWVSAWVLSDHQLFDAHDPLCFRMRLCSQRPCRHVWDLPRPWTGLGVTSQDFEDAFRPHCPQLLQQAQECASVEDIATALLDFSVACEAAVDTAVRLKHQQDPVRFPVPHLTRHYRGRCVDRKTLRRELPCLARPDRHGGYTPDEEVTSVLGRLKVRQVRRVATLYKGLAKYYREGATSASLRSQLLREWRAIGRAKGYAPSFAGWEKQTKEHKVLHCPGLADVRAKWLPYIGPAFERWPEWIHCPAATYPADLEVSQLVYHTRSLPDPRVNWANWPQAGARGYLRFFTDGSCTQPDLPMVSRASFAVILDTTSSDIEVPGLLDDWRRTKLAPTQFTVVCQGLVPGQQSINRAEVCAIIQALRAAALSGCHQVEIWTDSQYAINCWSAVAEGRTIGQPDLGAWLSRLYRPEVRLRKVASHQKLEDLWGLPCWFAAGNAAADSAAKLALKDEFDFVVDHLDTAATYLREQKDCLRIVWAYLLQLSETENQRIKTVRSPLAPPDKKQPATQDLEQLATWEQLNEGAFVTWDLPPPSREVLLACSWPPWYTLPVWSWLRQLRWRKTEAIQRRVPGVTYIELLLDFVASTGVLPPDSLAASHREIAAPRLWTRPFSIRMLVHNFVETIGQLERLCGYSLWGPRRKKVFSLQTLNVDAPRRGLQYRPYFRDGLTVGKLLQVVLTTETVDCLQRFVRDYTGTLMTDPGKDDQANVLL
ncbi:hypothetical protein AK812_SmicGene22606 [Symbiodinium microadriaticum]|uniref:RNase H type-1 domain-containing protein n=1 Tax=Symbiodinium microadriaticum TaxID=2951 RepID=A0A1Q9DJE7_SYMMI|nr:hypothetical protein AK812_SmicGene22606 [Symbiodinium microadriaticum]